MGRIDRIFQERDELKTVSNGLKVSEEYLPGPRRVDHWVFDRPLVSYLVCLAVGPPQVSDAILSVIRPETVVAWIAKQDRNAYTPTIRTACSIHRACAPVSNS